MAAYEHVVIAAGNGSPAVQILVESFDRLGVEWDQARLAELGVADDQSIRCQIGHSQSQCLRDA